MVAACSHRNQRCQFEISFWQAAGRKVLFVGNPMWHRTPLVLSLSHDGVHFNQHYILAEAHRDTPKTSDEYGYPAYPHSIVHDGYLYVIVSRDKNKIEVLRVALNEL